MAILSKYIFENFSPLNLQSIQELIVAKNIKPRDFETLSHEIDNIIKNGQIFKYLSTNIILAVITVLSAIFCFFAAIHLTVDKIFFKNYYEQASMFDAVRRGLFLDIVIFLVVYLKLYGIDLLTIGLVPILFLIIEIIFTSYIKKILQHRYGQFKAINEKIKQDTKVSREIGK